MSTICSGDKQRRWSLDGRTQGLAFLDLACEDCPRLKVIPKGPGLEAQTARGPGSRWMNCT